MSLNLGEVALYRRFLCISALHSLLSPYGQGPAGPRGGSDLCLQTQFHRLWDCISHVSGVCPLVGEVGQEARVGFLV